MTKNTWIIFIAACVVLFGGLIFLTKKDAVDVSQIDTNNPIAARQDSGNIGDHIFGKDESKVVLIEYGDFQCPGCEGAYMNLKLLKEKYRNQITFIFRNFPLTTIHPNAKAAAAAAEAAGLQGKYWEMHDALYDNQAAWSTESISARIDTFASYASTIGVKDIEKFKNDLSASEIADKISFDQALGAKAGVTGTPTLVLNGTKVDDETITDIIQGSGTKLNEKIVTLLRQNNIALPGEKKE
ncbi:MAG: DsbA family protein [Candidatus Saccharimonadales bacterium]